MTDRAKGLLLRAILLAFYLGGFLLLFASCASRQDVSNCVREQIDLALENWQNHPGPRDGRDSREILRYMIMRVCYDKGGRL